MNISPLAIEIIIHYHVSPSEDYKDSPAFRQITKELVSKGILLENTGTKREYEPCREACEVYINALISVPLPKQKWIIKD